MLTRRSLLGVAGATLADRTTALAQLAPLTTTPPSLGEGQPFEANAVIEMARVLARRPHQPQNTTLPDPFGNLNYEQYVSILPRPGSAIWAGEGRGFVVEPLHRGFVFGAPVTLHLVEDGLVRRIGYSPQRFTFPRQPPPPTLGDIGFSGFRVLVPNGGAPREVAIFQGATFFRSLANGQNLGVMARALALKIAEPNGEEFPFFRSFWIERPAAGANSIVVHALAESENCTGAFRFTLRPGDATIIDTEASLFVRTPVAHLGLGAMQSTFLFGANDRRGVDDLRPAVHESSGLQILNGSGEWLWRPLSNPEQLQFSAFLDQDPKGFGLLQRERDYTAYHDDDQHFELRPSLWIEPIGDWGPGSVNLVEIPTDSEIHDNIIAYWRPREPLAAGTELAFAYRQFWCWSPPERPALATATATRLGRAGNPRRRRFAVDFTSEAFATAGAAADLKIALGATPGTLSGQRLVPMPWRKIVRVLFELDPGNEPAIELRLILEAGGRPASETWLYRWTP